MKAKVFKSKIVTAPERGDIMYGQIYAIKNKINNKVYIGQTIRKSVLERYHGSISNTHNVHLKNAIRKYGEENFEITTLCWCKNKEELNQREIEYIELYNALDDKFGYNLACGGIGGAQPKEICKIISERQKTIWANDTERRNKASERNRGEGNPMHKSKGGHSEFAKQKMSKTKKEMFANGTLKISDKCKEVTKTPAVRKKMAEAKSKYVYIQYDKSMNEVYKTYILRELYDHMKENNLGLTVKTYLGFKNESCKKIVFNDEGFCGYYYKKIKKEDYANTEVS